MQIVLTVLLIAVLAAAVVSFVVMGLLQRRRRNILACAANESGMRFASDDPFDVPRRYANFALIGSGHSPNAHNFIYGQLEGWPVRAFDFHYEVGHGPRRMTRHYYVVVVETDLALSPVLMWDDQDMVNAPLSAQLPDGHVAHWSYKGCEASAEALKDAFIQLAEINLSFQICNKSVMLCMPVRRGKTDYRARLGEIVEILSPIIESRSVASHECDARA